MMTLTGTKCCGMREIDNLSQVADAETAMKEFVNQVRSVEMRGPEGGLRFGAVVFSGVSRRISADHASGRVDNYGAAFAAFIREKGLGDVSTSAEVRNPRTGNWITVWVWTINQPAYREYENSIQPPAPPPSTTQPNTNGMVPNLTFPNTPTGYNQAIEAVRYYQRVFPNARLDIVHNGATGQYDVRRLV